MNDLGLALAWNGVQVALFLVPAAVMVVLTARRSAAAAAWAASVVLGLVVVLSVAAVLPSPGWLIAKRAVADLPGAPKASPVETQASVRSTTRSAAPSSARGLVVSGDALRHFWRRLEHTTVAPVGRMRPWGRLLAVAGLAGLCVGLGQLLLGLWAVETCRRRGRAVLDAAMIVLLDELRGLMGCRRAVAIREVPDLTTPATAGVWRPEILLPEDWRTWNDSDRRAVLAHELAHIRECDYVASLVARLAVALQFFHPLVRWMADRLQLQQELAADALGAHFAGGRGPYLVALSRLALRQDGRSPSWPARAFLPGRGTLIRRIAMLRGDNSAVQRPWTTGRRIVVGAGLVFVAVGVATLRGPAHGDDRPTKASATPRIALEYHVGLDGLVQRMLPGEAFEPIELVYVPEQIHVPNTLVGLIAFRPAMAFGWSGLTRYAKLLQDECIKGAAQMFKLDPSKPGFITLKLEDIAWVTSGVGLHRSKQKVDGKERETHAIMIGGLTVRTIKPFPWLAFFRQFHCDFTEIRVGSHGFYRVTGFPAKLMGKGDGALYMPDDRTIVFDHEPEIRKLIARGPQKPPAYLAGLEWRAASRGILALALDNHDGNLVKKLDLGDHRPDDAVAMALFKGVDHVVVGVEDRDEITVKGTAVCNDGASSGALVTALTALLDQQRIEARQHKMRDPSSEAEALDDRMGKAFLEKAHVTKDGDRALLQVRGFGTVGDIAHLIETEQNETMARVQKDAAVQRTKR